MRDLLIFSFLFSLTATLFATNPPADEIVGIWWTSERDAQVEIFERNGRYFARSLWGEKIERDTNNPDPALRQRRTDKIEFIFNLRYEDGEWVDGEVYNPQDGKTYRCKIWLDDENELRLRGYLGPFYQTVNWYRARSSEVRR